MPIFFCRFEDGLADLLVAHVELALVPVDLFLGSVVRRVAAPGQKYRKKGLFGATCLASAIIAMALSARSAERW